MGLWGDLCKVNMALQNAWLALQKAQMALQMAKMTRPWTLHSARQALILPHGNRSLAASGHSL